MAAILDYELLDFGQGRKLERFGNQILDRPESMAEKSQPSKPDLWKSAQHRFIEKDVNKGVWKPDNLLDWSLSVGINKISISLKLHKGPYKHIGVFPEQMKHWRFIAKRLQPGQKMLNLFGYTGAASLVGATTGASVTHVDSSKSIMKIARENADVNEIDSIRFIQEDALKFAKREGKRSNTYDLIICDPPVFGRGAKNEIWKIQRDLPELIQSLQAITSASGLLILNTYSPKINIPFMSELVSRQNYKVIDRGWLSLKSSQNKELRLSKYVIGRNGVKA